MRRWSCLPEPSRAATAIGPPSHTAHQLDINTFYLRGPGWIRWYAIRLVLFAIGRGIGGMIWPFDDDSVWNHWLPESLIGNVYIWSCLIATGLYAAHDWGARRQQH
ncbi:hypothetical protein GCM10009743_25190 [Kribbella swartbergensis]